MAWPPPYGGMPPAHVFQQRPPPPGSYPPPHGAYPPQMRPPMGMPGMMPPGYPPPGTTAIRPPTALPPPPRPAVPVGAPPLAPTVPQKQLQAYVGKIPDGVEDSFIKNLLEQCGAVAKWERVTDPTSGKPKPFGFCKFTGAEGVLRALRLLNGMTLDDGALLLKVDQKTQAFLDEYEAEQRLAAQDSEANTVDSGDEEAKKIIEELVANRQATVGVIGNKSSDAVKDKDPLRDRDAEREEREAEREKERERRREREEEAQFRDREREWERREADRIREREREEQRQVLRVKDRERRITECEESEETDFEKWWSKYQDRIHQRRRTREREAEDDEQDRRRERDELAEKERIAKEQAEPAAEEGTGEDQSGGEADKKAPPGSVKLSFGMGAKSTKRKAPSFEREEEDFNKKLGPLVPIVYNEDEKLARGILEETLNSATAEEKAAEMKRLIATIPTEKADLLKYEVKWEIVDKNTLATKKMTPWVTKKIADYLGEEEPMLIKYVLDMLNEHTAASEIIEKLAVVLEDEAETFVIKMWRYLIFECMRCQAGLA